MKIFRKNVMISMVSIVLKREGIKILII